MRLRDLVIVPAFALAVMILNILIAFGVVWFWGTFFEPGHPQAYYEAFALKAAPVSSIVAGIPLMLGAGWLVARKRERRPGLIAAGAVALVYIIADTAMILATQVEAQNWVWELVSYPTKLVAAFAGGFLATRRA